MDLVRRVFFAAILTGIAQAQEPTPSPLLQAELAVCRISVINRDGRTQCHGSGCLFTHRLSPNKQYVLTAYHVVAEADPKQKVRVTWDGKTHYWATRIAARPGCDSVVLLVEETVPPDVPRIPVATKEIARGETAYAFGFGATNRRADANTLRSHRGVAVKGTFNEYNDPVWFDLSGHMRDGDSGGPVFVVRDGEVKLIGNLWGTGYDSGLKSWTTGCCRLTVLNRFYGIDKAPTRGYISGNRRVSPSPRQPNYGPVPAS